MLHGRQNSWRVKRKRAAATLKWKLMEPPSTSRYRSTNNNVYLLRNLILSLAMELNDAEKRNEVVRANANNNKMRTRMTMISGKHSRKPNDVSERTELKSGNIRIFKLDGKNEFIR